MAIQKTTVILDDGTDKLTFSEEGQANTVHCDGLTANKTYTVTATLDDSDYGEIVSDNSYRFTTLAAGTISLKDQGPKIDTGSCTIEVNFSFTSTYSADTARVLVDDNPSFKTAKTYVATVNGDKSGTIYCKINDFGFVEGETYYFQVLFYDFYGEEAITKAEYVFK